MMPIRGLNVKLSFDINEDIAAPYIATGARPKVAVLREQGGELSCGRWRRRSIVRALTRLTSI
ncbi:phosphoribosylformylglycinamidine synthase [Salmonella enterica subsp. enterica]|uniref:Phosphoribosylformylglycinamidine synthase n=1 Tax=Salmonella enterica I TaxID=59201 RepID=A0A447N652_SALET|nr:phosphoribosylformylglycinamidine synthase [Salmonella enterica subsp. enterica]